MSFQEIMTMFGSSGLIILILSFIEISPIKINPWSFILKIIKRILRSFGNMIFDGVNEKINEIDKKVTTLDTDMKNIKKKIEDVESNEEERDIINTRSRILSFGDNIMHGQLYSKERFEQTLLDIKKYNIYCTNHPDFVNNITAYHAELIEKRYFEHLEKNDFLH